MLCPRNDRPFSLISHTLIHTHNKGDLAVRITNYWHAGVQSSIQGYSAPGTQSERCPLELWKALALNRVYCILNQQNWQWSLFYFNTKLWLGTVIDINNHQSTDLAHFHLHMPWPIDGKPCIILILCTIVFWDKISILMR